MKQSGFRKVIIFFEFLIDEFDFLQIHKEIAFLKTRVTMDYIA